MNKMSRITEEGLSPQQQKFADAYLECGKIEKAAIAAGAPLKSARDWGSRHLRKPAVKKYIARRQNKVAKAAEKLEDRLIAELEALAFSNVEDYTRLDTDGQRRVDFSTATRTQLAAINKIKTKVRRLHNAKGEVIGEEENIEFAIAEKHSPIRTLMQFKGMLKPEEHRVTLDVSDRLLRARQRLAAEATERVSGLDTEILGVVVSRGEKPGGGGTGV